MKTIRNYTVALAAGVLLFAGYSQESAADPCANYATIQAIISDGNSCEIGDKTFSDFAVGGDLNASQVTILDVETGPVFWGFVFQFNLTATLPAGNASQDFAITYDIACTNGTACIDSIHADLTGSVQPPGAIGIGTLSETYTSSEDNGVIDLCFGVVGCVTSATVNITPVSSLTLVKDLNATCIAGAPASGVCIVTMSALTNTVDQVEVPEPGTLALLAAGLLGLGWVGRRRRDRA